MLTRMSAAGQIERGSDRLLGSSEAGRELPESVAEKSQVLHGTGAVRGSSHGLREGQQNRQIQRYALSVNFLKLFFGKTVF